MNVQGATPRGRNERYAALAQLAARQHGLISRLQAYRIGLDRNAVLRAIANGHLQRVGDDVFAMAGVPLGADQAAMAAVLQRAGSAVSHGSAACLWGMPGFRLDPVNVLVHRKADSRARSSATVHSSTDVLDEHITEVRGIPVTTPSRTIYDLAGLPSMHPDRVARLLDNLWSRRLVDHRSVARILGQHAERGRPGTVLLRELLEERPPDYRAPESGLESRFQQILRDAGLPAMERQIDVGDGQRWIGRVDFIDRGRRVIVQIDSEFFHGSVLDRERDAAQTAALEATGYVVVRVTEFDVWHRPADVVERLRGLLTRRQTAA